MSARSVRGLWAALLWGCRAVWRGCRPPPTTYGRDRLARRSDLRRHGLLRRQGLIIGRSCGRPVRFAGEGHVTMIAPPRAGKGTTFIVPNLLTYPGSVVCTDPKGENRDITARRRAQFGPVYVLDATQPWTSHQLNPFDLVRRNTHAVDDAAHLAGLLVAPDPAEAAHWRDKAVQLLTGLILTLIATKPKELQTLPELFRVVSGGEAALKCTLLDMAKLNLPTIVATAHDQLDLLETREGKSIVSTARKSLALWAPDRPAAHLVQTSDFQLADFKRATATLFIVIDGDKAEIYAPFMRLFTGLALAAMTREPFRPAHPVVFMLDEARLLGRLDDLSRLISYGAGFGVCAVPIWQDARQVTELYGTSSLIDQCSVQLYLGINSTDKAIELSRRCGQYTVRARSHGRSGRADALIDGGHHAGENDAGRPVIYPSELMASDAVFAFLPKCPAIKCHPVPYFRDRKLKGMWDVWRGHLPAPHGTPPWELLNIPTLTADTPVLLPSASSVQKPPALGERCSPPRWHPHEVFAEDKG